MSGLGSRAFLAPIVVAAALLSTAWLGQLPAASPPPRPKPLPRAVTAPTPAATPAPVTPPTLMATVTEGRPAEPMEIARVDIQTTIVGYLARTTTTLTFRNPHPRPLEGELVFPLPAGATVAGYALDIGGEMVDGVVVEAQQARVAFEKELRRRVDPGLVEWVRGNNFRTRVFPIPAQGTRTIRVAYVADLVSEGGGDACAALYYLPLRFPGVVDEFRLRVEVDKTATAPEVRAASLANFRFAAWQDRFVAETEQHGVRLTDDLVVALPHVPRANTAVESHGDGQHYFVVDDLPEVPARPAQAIAPPQRVGLFWDASLSRRETDMTRERDVLRTWLGRQGDVELVLTVFRDVAERPRTFHVRAGDATELLQFLKAVPYDGGTNLAAVPFDADVSWSVLVSDGVGNLGDGLPSRLRAPIYAINADPSADHNVLTHLAERSGGAYLNLARMTNDAAAAAIGTPPAATVRAEFDPAALADVMPEGSQPVTSRVTFCGRLLAPETTLTLHYTRADGGTDQRSFVLRKKDAGTTGLVPRFWAAHRVDELALFPERNHDELLALGRRFGVVTPGASLLVLETLQQYVEHGIEPPENRPAMREAYLKQSAERVARQAETKKEKLNRVAALWEQRVAWWEREFPLHPPEAKKETGVTGSAMRRRDGDRRSEPTDELGVEGGVADHVEGGVPGGVVGGVIGAGAPPPPAAAAPRARMAAEPQAAAGERSAVLGSEAIRNLVARDAARPTSASATIAIKAWDPHTPYLAAMKAAAAADAYAVYLRERREYGTSPAFYLDCADFFLNAGHRDLGIRLLTDIVELKLDDARLLRVAAHRLEQVGEHDLAITLFEKVLRLRPEEPQSLRDLALALAVRGDARRAAKAAPNAIADDYLRAVDLLNRVVESEWDGRFAEIELVALMEANRLIAILDRERLPGRERVALDPRLRRLLDVDVRVVLTWDTDMTDMDLWVIEPTGERCFYGNRLTRVGGALSRDFTAGYGPEEYSLKRAPVGAYAVKANFYGSNSQSLTGPTTVQATVFTNFGRPNEQRRTLTLRLTEAKEVVDVGTVRFGDAAITK
jgi:Ca-activated chloride channel family protein